MDIKTAFNGRLMCGIMKYTNPADNDLMVIIKYERNLRAEALRQLAVF